jgi:putative hemolysin
MSSSPSAARDALDALTDINVDDLLDAAGLRWLGRSQLRHLFRRPARRFARLALAFDQRVGTHGLAAGSTWMLKRMTAGLQLGGALGVPSSGPLLVLANHPGMTDTVSLLAALASRPDLRVMAGDRPFLRSLPHVARSLILLPESGGGQLRVLRAAVAHLRQGGALLTFPAGRIEPDPATCGPQPAIESLQRWSDSAVLLARQVPQARWFVALVSNVVSAQAQQHPLTWLRRGARNKEKLAAALQVALPRYRRMTARVDFGPLQDIKAGDAASLHAAMLTQARRLVEELPRDVDAAALRAMAARESGAWRMVHR